MTNCDELRQRMPLTMERVESAEHESDCRIYDPGDDECSCIVGQLVDLAADALALLDENEALRVALRGLVELCRAEYEGEGYGPFPGGDPRNFKPDEEDCTHQELENWRAACEEWERGEGVDRGSSCQYLGDGSVYAGTGFGVGTYRYIMPEVDAALAVLGDAP